MIVAIHQPNYLPWAGYFHKLARADVFVFLDDVQFPKNSYVNRVRILDGGRAVWLTVPAKPKLGTPIGDVVPAQADWPARHLSRLRNAYAGAAAFKVVWLDIEDLYGELAGATLADANRRLIEGVAGRLGLAPRFVAASEFPGKGGVRADARLVELVKAVGGHTYLSGHGGADYQDPAVFETAGVGLEYSDFKPVPYSQTADGFMAGLSIIDAIFNLGWSGAAAHVAA